VVAARIHEWGGGAVVEEVADPEPAAGEALVEVTAAALAHIDLTVSSGRFAFRPRLPHVPGTEGAGRVLRSERLPAGTLVHVRGGGVGLRRDGTCAERVTVPDDALVDLPERTDPVLAAIWFSPCATARAAVHEVGGLAAGERVAVVGAGGAVGAMVVQLAQRAGAAEVVGLVRRPGAQVPAGVTVLQGPGALERLEPVDLLVDTVGGAGLAERVTRAVRPGGRAVLVGYVAGEAATFDLPALLAADVRLLPVSLIRWERRLREVARELLDELQAGELVLPHTLVGLDELPRALERLRAGELAGRVAVLIADRDEPAARTSHD
jgi:NADPH:quinone reductase